MRSPWFSRFHAEVHDTADQLFHILDASRNPSETLILPQKCPLRKCQFSKKKNASYVNF